MKIVLDNKTVFLFPTRLVINRFFAGIIRGKLRKEGVRLTHRQTVAMIKAFVKYRKETPHWNLIEATQKDGRQIIIRP